MLLDKKLKIEAGKIYSFKLVTGEELVAKVDSVDDEKYYLHKPMVLIVGHDGNARFIPYIMTVSYDVNPVVSVRIGSIICEGETFSDIEKQYVSDTSMIQLQ